MSTVIIDPPIHDHVPIKPPTVFQFNVVRNNTPKKIQPQTSNRETKGQKTMIHLLDRLD